MTTAEIMPFQIEESGYGLAQVLKDWPADKLEVKLHDSSMTVIEHMSHLCECYIALMAHRAGEKHSWGTFAPASIEFAALHAELFAHRAEIQAPSDDFKDQFLYVVAHDNYHIGQLCALRMMCDPAWNAYSIYRD